MYIYMNLIQIMETSLEASFAHLTKCSRVSLLLKVFITSKIGNPVTTITMKTAEVLPEGHMETALHRLPCCWGQRAKAVTKKSGQEQKENVTYKI